MMKILLSVLLACHSLVLHADSWSPAKVQAKSDARGLYVVRVEPGSSKGDVIGFAGDPKGPYAKAEWHKYDGSAYRKVRTSILLNPIAPNWIVITEKGNLITLDNWHNRGYGYVLVIYKVTGEVLKRYRLQDLYDAQDIKRIERSVSSIHWRCHEQSAILDSPGVLWVDDSLGGRFVVNVETGSFVYERGVGECAK